ncbi:uncharacterized protein DNG_03196 [Cephalotrichum gorgonifer]|uniref:Saccharopine dehydrogenase NADP binding domain-containing protein n=1 Tax=Cephalotrichum gorgonifer TaxID=2041049 RepID=A0AAE8STE5_9PEZI|nr:uncharacterized protein DNG_03196 [Cephalotrichum gorgonifer]
MAAFMIYGAYGYTGRIASEYAATLGLQVILAGRSDRKIRDLASKLDTKFLVFDVNDPFILDAALKGVRVFLNCAGPFMRTASPLMAACIRNGVHYLDIAAELDSYRLAEKLDAEASEKNVMLMPGCGGSVAMLGCLAGYAAEGIEKPVSIDVALLVAGSMSRGSAVSASENLTAECLKRVDGELIAQDTTATDSFDFNDGKGSVSCFPVTLPDLITIWKSTGASNIRTFVHVAGNAFPSGDLDALPDGPTAQEREANPYHASVTVAGADGTVKRAALHTVNGYTFTPLASVQAAERILGGEVVRGFQTPATVFGSRFVKSVRDTVLETLE